jgi:hypothetical protein
MRRESRRGVAVVAIAVAGAAALAACGGGSKDLTSGLSPAEILNKSRETAAQVSFYHPKLELALDVTAAPGASGGFLSRLSGTPVTITAEGPVRRPIAEGGAAFSFDVTAQLGPLPIQGNITKVGDGVYLNLGGRAYALPLTADEAKAVRIPPEPALFVADPQEVGNEEVNGVQTVHLQGKVATDAVVDYLVELLRGAPGLLGGAAVPDDAQLAAIRDQLRGAISESRSDIWIGTKDLLPHRVAARIAIKGPLDLLPGIATASLDVRADVTGFDQASEIVAPANPAPFDLNSLLPGLGI